MELLPLAAFAVWICVSLLVEIPLPKVVGFEEFSFEVLTTNVRMTKF